MSGPHDLFVRFTFGHPERAAAELRAVLPPELVAELFEIPEEGALSERWRALVPRFEYQVDDLTTERAESLMERPGPPLVRLALLALRYGRTEELAERLPGWTALFAQVDAAPNGAEEFRTVVHYLLLVGDKAAQGAAVDVLKSVAGAQRAEELMTTWGEELIEKGRQRGRLEGQAEGLAEGLAKARAEDVLRILAARGVLVEEKVRQRILSCTEMATLDRWFDKALTATTLAEVLGDLTQ